MNWKIELSIVVSIGAILAGVLAFSCGQLTSRGFFGSFLFALVASFMAGGFLFVAFVDYCKEHRT